MLTAGSGGHFLTEGSINGRAAYFMVDTGATSIGMGASHAEGLGLDISYADQTWTHGRQLSTVLAHAAMGVYAGMANYVACVCGINWSRLGTVGTHGQMQDDNGVLGELIEGSARLPHSLFAGILAR